MSVNGNKWVYMRVYETMWRYWMHMMVYGWTCAHMDVYENIWWYMNANGSKWMYMKVCEALWWYMNALESV